jgi:tRNA A-37 threonylcarbamoyl transferase component Bud32
MGWLKQRLWPDKERERIFQPPGWVWARSGDVGWWVRPQWLSSLIGDRGLRLSEWREQGKLHVVKSGPQRVVYRADLAEGSVYVKHYLVPDVRAILRQWVRRGKGRNEGRRSLLLEAIGVPTITPIALGEQRRGHFLLENFLITPEIPDAIPLDEFLENRLPEQPEPERSRIRRALATELAILTARLHEAGFLHNDFHPGNLLVRVDEAVSPSLSMIDLDALRVARRLTWAKARDNLAVLNHSFWLNSARSDRGRFLREYLKARRTAPPRVGEFARSIERATRSWAERLWNRWGKRCRGTNKYFKKFHSPRASGLASRELDRDEMKALLDDPDAPFARPETLLLKEARTATVAETTMTVNGIQTRVIHKRFNRKKWLDPLLTYFRPSRAWQAWQAGQHLATRAIPTPTNLAYLSRRRSFLEDPLFWYLPHETYLVTVKAEPSITVGDYLRTVLPTLAPKARRDRINSLTPALARLLRTLHERSLSDRDLKTANILIVGDPNATEPRLTLIDLVGVRKIHPLPRHRRVQNLARLSLSLEDVPGRTRTDALRFLRAYLPGGLAPRDDWKQLAREVAAWGRRKIQQNQKRGRKLS